MINIDECLIVHRAGAHLVVAGREKLDHVVPVLLIFSFVHVFQTDLLKAVYNGLHVSESIRSHMIMAEIIDVERFGVDLVHGACGVCHSCHFVGVIFLPPVERSRDIHGDEDLADKLSMVTSRHAETLREVEIVRSEDEISVLIIAAVHTPPAVQRVSRAAHGIFKVHDTCAFKFYHNVFSPWLKSGEKAVRCFRAPSTPPDAFSL